MSNFVVYSVELFVANKMYVFPGQLDAVMSEYIPRMGLTV